MVESMEISIIRIKKDGENAELDRRFMIAFSKEAQKAENHFSISLIYDKRTGKLYLPQDHFAIEKLREKKEFNIVNLN